jgi:hypothetical protein
MAVVSVRPEHVAALEELAADVALGRVGTVGGERIVVAGAAIDVAEATALYEGAIPRALGEAEDTV